MISVSWPTSEAKCDHLPHPKTTFTPSLPVPDLPPFILFISAETMGANFEPGASGFCAFGIPMIHFFLNIRLCIEIMLHTDHFSVKE